jgi:hypothetical protein
MTIVGLALLGLLATLLALPAFQGHPVGGAVLWVIGYGTVALLMRQVWLGSARIREWWRSIGRSQRWSGVLAVVFFTLVGGLVMRETAPELFRRFSRENGLWEPLCLLMYWGGALLLYRHVRGFELSERKPWLLLVGVYALLGLEEIDYFGIFGRGVFGPCVCTPIPGAIGGRLARSRFRDPGGCCQPGSTVLWVGAGAAEARGGDRASGCCLPRCLRARADRRATTAPRLTGSPPRYGCGIDRWR